MCIRDRFYPISEEIVTPGDGYCHELKKSEEVIPQVAEYLHAINQTPTLELRHGPNSYGRQQ